MQVRKRNPEVTEVVEHQAARPAKPWRGLVPLRDENDRDPERSPDLGVVIRVADEERGPGRNPEARHQSLAASDLRAGEPVAETVGGTEVRADPQVA